MKTIFLLNGPASSGKDSLASFLWWELPGGCFIDKFAYPLKQANKVMFSLSEKDFIDYDTNAELKNAKCDRFYGKSWRQVNIDLSEDFIKTHYGDDFFGRSLVERIKQKDGKVFLIPDSGFLSEAQVVVDAFGKENVFLIKLLRQGYTFAGDSRNYINGADLGIKEYSLINDDYHTFLNDGYNLIKGIINENSYS